MNQSNGKYDPFAEIDRYTAMGQIASGQVGGDPKQLERYLLMLYDHDNVVVTVANDIQRLEEDNTKYEEEIAKYSNQVQILVEKKQREEQERDRLISERQSSINNQNAEICRIKKGDYTLLGTHADPANKPGFWIGTIILVLLTIYLINFYASVLYNAFLLDPILVASESAEAGSAALSVTIVNLHAFEKVFTDYGWIGLIFLLSGTFVFIALGFLLHWFTQGTRIWALVAIYAFTFLLDAFLAYEIVRKIYEAKLIFMDLRPWKFTMAFKSADFYIILLAGFGMYVAWGLLYKYVIEEYSKILPELTGIGKRRAEIKRLNQDIKEVHKLKNSLIKQLGQDAEGIQQREVNFRKSNLQLNQTQIKELRVKIREYAQHSKKTMQELHTHVTFFLSGWLYEVRERENGQSAIKVEECHKVVEKFYHKIGYN